MPCTSALHAALMPFAADAADLVMLANAACKVQEHGSQHG
jgi:hypothetical protein